MRSFLAGWLTLAVAAAFVWCLYLLRSHRTRWGSWQRLVTWPLPLLAFFPVWPHDRARVAIGVVNQLRFVPELPDGC